MLIGMCDYTEFTNKKLCFFKPEGNTYSLSEITVTANMQKCITGFSILQFCLYLGLHNHNKS